MEQIRVIGCGAIAREILAICEANGLSHIDLACLPAILHVHPQRIAGEVEREILEAREEGFEKIYVAYADCGTGGELDKVCNKFGVERIPGPHCYSFFTGNARFDRESGNEITAFYLTDFLARQFDAFVTKPLGLDKHPELKDMYFGNYEKLVYLVQEEDEELDRRAEKAARFLGLQYERRITGYGDLTSELSRLKP